MAKFLKHLAILKKIILFSTLELELFESFFRSIAWKQMIFGLWTALTISTDSNCWLTTDSDSSQIAFEKLSRFSCFLWN